MDYIVSGYSSEYLDMMIEYLDKNIKEMSSLKSKLEQYKMEFGKEEKINKGLGKIFNFRNGIKPSVTSSTSKIAVLPASLMPKLKGSYKWAVDFVSEKLKAHKEQKAERKIKFQELRDAFTDRIDDFKKSIEEYKNEQEIINEQKFESYDEQRFVLRLHMSPRVSSKIAKTAIVPRVLLSEIKKYFQKGKEEMPRDEEIINDDYYIDYEKNAELDENKLKVEKAKNGKRLQRDFLRHQRFIQQEELNDIDNEYDENRGR